MASLGGQTVASSFDRLLTLPAGGGDGANLIALTDGNEGTTFTLKLSTGGISIEGGDKLYLDGGSDTYIQEADGGRIEMWANGQMMLWCDKAGGDNNVEIRATNFNIRNEVGESPMLRITALHPDSTGTTHVHTIQPEGTGYADDVILLGRADSDTNTNVVLNAKVGIGTHAEYPTGPRSYFHVQGNNGVLSEQIHIDPDLGGMVQTTTGGATTGWTSGYNFGKLSDLTTLAGFHGYGSGMDLITRLSIAPAYNDADGVHVKMSNGYLGQGTISPTYPIHSVSADAEQNLMLETSGASCGLRMQASGTTTGSNFLGLICAGDVLHMYTSNTSRLAVRDRGVLIGGASGNSGNTNSIHIINGVQGDTAANEICIGAKDASTSNESTLSLYCEEDPVAHDSGGAYTNSHKMKIWLNGTEYWIVLDAV